MGVTMQDASDVAAELRKAIADHDVVCEHLGVAEENYKRAYLAAHANSTTVFPDRKVKEHEVAAQQGSFNEWAALNALTYERKALAERIHSLRQVLFSYDTQLRAEAAMR